jgi:protein involved in polysaccharide export with SLBB domain
MRRLSTHPLIFIISVQAILLLPGAADSSAQAPRGSRGGASSTPQPKPAFRGTAVGVEDVQRNVEAQKSTGVEAQQEVESLTEQQRSLESQLTHAKTMLEAARKKLAIQSALGKPEAADQAEQEVKDWEGRVKSIEAQLAQVNKELQAALGSPPAGMGGDVIVPGENIEVFVVEDASFNGRYQVRRGGYVILPQVGRIYVAGKSIDAAEHAVKKALESTQLKRATVMIERIQGADIESGPVIYLAGEFKSPRPFRLQQGVTPTLVGVILSSGGVTDKADMTRVRVMRVAALKGVVEEINVQRILEGAGLTSDITLDDGDVVVIPAGSANVVYLTGRVKRPGTIPLKPGDKLSAYAAILQSGGFDRFADMKKVYILRALPDGTKSKIKVNVIDIQRGHAPDVPLQGNDILVVPEKFFSF